MRDVRLFRLLGPVFVLLGFGVARASAVPILFEHPTVNATEIVFAYAGSLWSVDRRGGAAERLTSGEQTDAGPIFSPDGSMLAFTRTDAGHPDVYVMPGSGGMARRLTWYPGMNVAVGWTRGGRSVLLRSMRYSVDEYFRLFTVSLAGGLPAALPLPYATQGSYSPRGRRIAYVPFRNHTWFEAWKHYRGGLEPRIRIARLDDSSVASLPRGGGANEDPMWIGGAVYFLSDRTGGHVRLYRYGLRSKRVTAVSPDDGHDILSATSGAAGTAHPAIVYTEMGKLFLYDVRTGAIHRVPVRLHADFPSAHPHWSAVGHELTDAGLSPHGVRAVFEAHGDIVTVPAKYGDAEDITRTPGAFEREPAWSPNGKWIAYFSDASGQYELYVSPQTGIGRVRKIRLGPNPTYFYDPQWSPDSRYIAFHDISQHLWIVNVKTGELTLVAKRYYDEAEQPFETGWSPDSRWLAYSTVLPNELNAVFVYSLASGRSTRVTDGMSDAEWPRFDPSGKYLYFLASTNPNPSFAVGELSAIDYPTVYSPYVAVLRSDLPSPLAPRPGEEKPAPARKGGKPKKKRSPATPVRVTIDFAGLHQRILALPMPPRAYADLEVSAPGVLWLAAGPVVAESRADHPDLALYRFSLEKRAAALVLPAVKAFVLSADGKHLLIEQGPSWRIVPAAAKIPPGGALKTSGLRVYVDPPQQWRQMYREVWRIERDFFYSPQMNGLNLGAAERYYSRFLPGVRARSDLAYLLHDMLGDLTVSHLFLFPEPPAAGSKPVAVGLLGADYSIDHGRYRFSRVFSGESWNPRLYAPLTQPGVNVKAGDYLLAVDGRSLAGSDNIYAFFQNTAGEQTVLTVSPDPRGRGARQVTVVPVASEAALRKRAWIHDNRVLVDKLSGGRLAYVYLPDTENEGWRYFNRYFFSQIGKQGVIVDERFNHGGYLANYVVNQLTQPLLSFAPSRYGHDQVIPAAIFGPKVMIANHFSGSGGDYLPYIFKMEHVGTLVGTRTWGGLVGIGDYPVLMDGSMVTAPNGAIYFPNGRWDVENHGVTPDVTVRMDPEAWRQGEDPQLRAAVAIALRQLKAHPWHEVPPPPYPDYYRGTPFARLRMRSTSAEVDLSGTSGTSSTRPP